jgi:hypothetical protein
LTHFTQSDIKKREKKRREKKGRKRQKGTKEADERIQRKRGETIEGNRKQKSGGGIGDTMADGI